MAAVTWDWGPRRSIEAAMSSVALFVALAVALVFEAGIEQYRLVRTGIQSAPHVPFDGLALALLALLLAWAMWLGRSVVRIGYVHVVMTVLVISAINIVTHDASAGAQFYLALPVLFGAYHLRFVPALTVVIIASIGQAAVAAFNLDAAAAVHDTLYGAMVMCTITVIVSRLRDSQDKLSEALETQAHVDGLTGLFTRHVLEDEAETALAEGSTTLLLIDLDHFKMINDTFGHPVGDRVLSLVAQTLREHTRPTDLVARLGGDELAVLLRDCPVNVGRARGQQMVDAVISLDVVSDDGRRVPISISVGAAALTPEHAQAGLPALYNAADACLYQAKRAGRGRVGMVGQSG